MFCGSKEKENQIKGIRKESLKEVAPEFEI